MPALRSIQGPGPRMGTAEAARYLGIAPQTLNKYRHIGCPHIPYSKVGRKVVYAKADLDAFLLKHRVEAPPTAA